MIMRPMEDPFGREITNLRISVTQRCNLACFYCHKEGQTFTAEEMSLEEINKIFDIAKQCGIEYVKITGGEPLVREDIIDIVAEANKRFKDVSMTTNGLLLKEKGKDLAEAGLHRVNVSLDTLDPQTYKKLTGVDRLDEVIEGLQAAKGAGIDPIKINMTLIKEYNDSELENVLRFCGENDLILQIIEFVAKKEDVRSKFYDEHHVDLGPVDEHLSKMAVYSRSRSMQKRRRYRIPINGREARVEVVKPMHNTEFCKNCSRLRVTSNGSLKPCLLNREGLVDILGPIRSGADDEALRNLFIQAINNRTPYWSDDEDDS
jgi:cyclic pyranopterin phosphate synthase